MNRKKLIGLVAVAFCIVMVARVSAHPTMLYFTFDPPDGLSSIKEYPPGEEINATLRVDVVSDLYLWVATIEWDSTVLEMVGYTEGGCLKSSGYPTSFMPASVVPGKITELTCTLLGAPSGVDVPTAPDDLANITFRVIGEPCNYTDISITFSDLLDYPGASIDHTTELSGVHVIPEVASVVLGLGAMLGALVIYRYRRKNQ